MSLIDNAQLVRLALAESLELLDRAVNEADKRLTKAREEVEQAEVEWKHWNTRRHLFKQAARGESATGGME